MVLLLALLLLQSDGISVHASLTHQALAAGAHGELVVSFELAEGWHVAPNPVLPGLAPAAMFQLDTPPEIELLGTSAADLSALLRQGFLDLPHEGLLETGTNAIAFRVVKELPKDAELALNVLAYVAPEAGTDRRPRLIRQRLRVPLRPGAKATLQPGGDSSWGRGDVLTIGETVPTFELPTPFGEPLATEDFLEDGLVVLTTYRSCL